MLEQIPLATLHTVVVEWTAEVVDVLGWYKIKLMMMEGEEVVLVDRGPEMS